MKITFVNHASTLIEAGPVGLLTDPWLFGDAFDHGWELLSRSRFEPEDFQRVSHVWFSHEHPDHFSTAVVRAIPEALRGRIAILYQKTRDGKVLGFCRKLGFEVRELPDRGSESLAPGFDVLIDRVPMYDSWMLATVGDRRILNLNDCILDDRRSLEAVRRRTGPVDVLFTQFGYANWAGNPEDAEQQRRLAEFVRERMLLQVDVFRPEYVVPFASFIRFCHRENSYLSENNNKIRSVYERLASGPSTPVVLYPGDEWDARGPRDSLSAIERYEADAREPVALRESRAVPPERLFEASEERLARIRGRNNRLLIALLSTPVFRYFAPLRIELLDDPGRVFVFDLRRGLREAPLDGEPPEISMHSESLEFLLRHDYGVDTLLVNGRFRASQASYRKLLRLFSLGTLNNTGRFLGFRLIADADLLWWAFKRLYLRYY